MVASDLRIAVRNKQFFVVDVTTAATVAGPFPTAFEAIEARKQLARVDLTATMTTARRTAQGYREELDGLGRRARGLKTERATAANDSAS